MDVRDRNVPIFRNISSIGLRCLLFVQLVFRLEYRRIEMEKNPFHFQFGKLRGMTRMDKFVQLQRPSKQLVDDVPRDDEFIKFDGETIADESI